MHPLIRLVRILLFAVALGLPNGGRPEESFPDDAPYKHLLTGDDAKRVEVLNAKVQDLEVAGNFAEAQAPAREIVAIRTRTQGAGHWQTKDSERDLETLKRIAALADATQAEYASSLKAQAEAGQLLTVGR